MRRETCDEGRASGMCAHVSTWDLYGVSCVIGNELRVFWRAQNVSVRSNITVKREN